ncbi:esterase [Rhodococcoides trifolii]|uniref:Esterase n=1 Tax=Rhodococcoides trifolii TaxID=908250 RepID=A0A917FQB0_9NOCA|nr:esterase [Rhodococcus trifolii]
MGSSVSRRILSIALSGALSLTAAAVISAAPAGADPVSSPPLSGITASDGTRVVSVTPVPGVRRFDVTVYSPSMDRTVDLQVFRPADTSVPRSTVYLLNGASGGEDSGSNWPDQADVQGFFADKNVNVVIPRAGAFSYYTDWKSDDPELGRNKWTTFFTKELPPVLNDSLGATGKQSIAGISTSGSSVLMLAANAPTLYSSVAAFSGCARTSDELGQAYVKLVVEARGGGETVNMWGKTDDPDWAANDAVLQADRLPRIPYYIATGNGLPGFDENLQSPRINGNVSTLVDRVVLGGGIEAITNACTHQLADRFSQLGIPATFDFRDNGTHSWAYWEDDLHKAWPMLRDSIGA